MVCGLSQDLPFVQASDLSNHEALPRRFHHRFGYFCEGVNFENSLDLGQQSRAVAGYLVHRNGLRA